MIGVDLWFLAVLALAVRRVFGSTRCSTAVFSFSFCAVTSATTASTAAATFSFFMAAAVAAAAAIAASADGSVSAARVVFGVVRLFFRLLANASSLSSMRSTSGDMGVRTLSVIGARSSSSSPPPPSSASVSLSCLVECELVTWPLAYKSRSRSSADIVWFCLRTLVFFV